MNANNIRTTFKIIQLIIIFSMLFIISNCSSNAKKTIRDIEIFKNSPAWELALAVKDNDTLKIKEFAKNVKIDYQDTLHGLTLLIWAIANDKYESAKKLLELGADPNIKPFKKNIGDSLTKVVFHYDTTYISTFNSVENAMYYACINYMSSKYVELLFKYGVKDNRNCDTSKKIHPESYMITAAFYNFKSFKLLEKAGGNLDLYCPIHNSPLYHACSPAKIDFVYYLVIEKKVDVTKPLLYANKNIPLYFVSFLREMCFKIGSEEYKKKMEIVKFIKDKYGIDYYKEPIPQRIQEHFDKDYLDKY